MDGKLSGKLSQTEGLTGRLSGSKGLSGSHSMEAVQIPSYSGSTEFTPTDSVQVIEAAGFLFEENITINAIPSNYGLITWNGSTLTVS